MYAQSLLEAEIPLADARTLSAIIERWEASGVPANALDRLLVEQYRKPLENLGFWRNGALIQTPEIYYEVVIHDGRNTHSRNC